MFGLRAEETALEHVEEPTQRPLIEVRWHAYSHIAHEHDLERLAWHGRGHLDERQWRRRLGLRVTRKTPLANIRKAMHGFVVKPHVIDDA